jgi:hypothetical protein
MSDHESLNKALQLLLRYIKGEEFTMIQLKRITGSSDRTVRNYHETFNRLSFEIEYSNSTKRYSLKNRDEKDLMKLITRLGLARDLYFNEMTHLDQFKGEQPIQAGLTNYEDNSIRLIYNLFIKEDNNIVLEDIPVREYKQIIDIINYLNTLK